MADSATTHYGWILPEVGASADTWGTKWVSALSGVDTTVFAVSTVASAAMPKAGGAFTGAVTSSSTFSATGFTGPLTGNTAGVHTGAVTGNVTGNVSGSSGSCTGNAVTATTAGGVTAGAVGAAGLAAGAVTGNLGYTPINNSLGAVGSIGVLNAGSTRFQVTSDANYAYVFFDTVSGFFLRFNYTTSTWTFFGNTPSANTPIFSIDASGNVVAAGSITPNGTVAT